MTIQIATVFATVFLAEIGDKTQLATLMFATDRSMSPLAVFLASASALVLTSAIAVTAGGLAGRYLDMLPLKAIAGLGFMAIGGWMLFEHVAGR
jgi:putative Ca2+/H+ antiporter (TMEM165/GDT1 family)